MKKFKGNRRFDDIISLAEQDGWEVDTDVFNEGGDSIWVRDMFNRILQIRFNTFNGHFFVYSPISDKPIATHLSSELDNEEWYQEILDLFYIVA